MNLSNQENLCFYRNGGYTSNVTILGNKRPVEEPPAIDPKKKKDDSSVERSLGAACKKLENSPHLLLKPQQVKSEDKRVPSTLGIGIESTDLAWSSDYLQDIMDYYTMREVRVQVILFFTLYCCTFSPLLYSISLLLCHSNLTLSVL